MIDFRLYANQLANATSELDRMVIEAEPVEPPEIWFLIQRMHYPDRLPVAGGYFDQPFVLMQELRSAELANQEADRIILINEKAKARNEVVGADSHVGVLVPDDIPPFLKEAMGISS